MAKQVTSVFDRDRTLMRGWPTQQLPLMCLTLLCMHNKSWQAGLTAQDHHNRLELEAGPLSCTC